MPGLILVAVSRGYSQVTVQRLLITVAPLVAEHGLLGSMNFRRCGSWALDLEHSLVVMARGLNCQQNMDPPGPDSNLCPLHWQANSQAQDHQRSPCKSMFNLKFLSLEKNV